MSKIKQVLVIRKDLKMRRGKEIAQMSHASISFLTKRMDPDSNGYVDIKLSKVETEWLDTGFAKICVRVNSEEELLDIYQKSIDAGLECHLITDSGLTEFDGMPTRTCLAIGPDTSEKIDKVTGSLELY